MKAKTLALSLLSLVFFSSMAQMPKEGTAYGFNDSIKVPIAKADSIVFYDWDYENGFQRNVKFVYEYDNKKNKVLELIYSENTGYGIEDAGYKIEYGYDSNNNLTSKEEYDYYYGGLSWEEKRKLRREYDDNNNITLYEYSGDWWNLDEETNIEYKISYEYDSSNRIISKIKSKFSEWDGDWMLQTKMVYEYNAQGKITLQTAYVYYEWDEEHPWLEDYKTVYSYENGNLILEEGFKFQYYDGEVWEEDTKTNYAYDSNNNLIMEETYYWNGEKWRGGSHYYPEKGKIVYVYNSNNTLIKEEFYEWYSNKWSLDYAFEYIYDKSNRLIFADYYCWFYTTTNQAESTSSSLKSTQSEWTKSSYFAYYYKTSEDESSIQSTKTSSTNIYPTITTDKVFIETETGDIPQIWVFNMQGTQLQQTQSNEIDLSGYAAGIYLLQVNDEEARKVMKK